MTVRWEQEYFIDPTFHAFDYFMISFGQFHLKTLCWSLYWLCFHSFLLLTVLFDKQQLCTAFIVSAVKAITIKDVGNHHWSLATVFCSNQNTRGLIYFVYAVCLCCGLQALWAKKFVFFPGPCPTSWGGLDAAFRMCYLPKYLLCLVSCIFALGQNWSKSGNYIKQHPFVSDYMMSINV